MNTKVRCDGHAVDACVEQHPSPGPYWIRRTHRQVDGDRGGRGYGREARRRRGGAQCGLNGTRARRRPNKNTKMRLFPPHAAGPPTCARGPRQPQPTPAAHLGGPWERRARVGHGPTALQRHERRKTDGNGVLASFSVNSGFGRQVGRAIDPLVGGRPHVIGARGLARPRGWGSIGGAWACVRGAFGPLSLVAQCSRSGPRA